MKRQVIGGMGLVIALVLGALAVLEQRPPAPAPPTPGPTAGTVYFSPRGGCTQAVVDALNAATTSVYVQAYSFTSAPIARALVDARKRGVTVAAILDKSQRTEHYSEADFLAHMGVPTFIDAQHAIAHNKVMILDGKIVITGSFNFTRAAEERNAENLLILHDARLATQYQRNWNTHRAHSEPYVGR